MVQSRHNPSDPEVIQYQVDARNQLVRLNPESGLPLGKDLLSCISDSTLRELYRQLLKVVRRGHPLRFNFRCDGPTERRLYEMRMEAGRGGVVRFSSALVTSEKRTEVPLFDPDIPRTDKLVRVCSWCQRINALGTWLPVEEAVDKLGLMRAPVLPGLTHGICEDCYHQTIGLIDEADPKPAKKARKAG